MPIPAYPAPAPSIYPKTLPNPSVSVVTPGERRLLSDVSGGPLGARGIERDYKAVQDLEWGALDATQAAALNLWWTDTLTQGGAWFGSTWPAPQGWVLVTRRFQGALHWDYIPGGFWKVTAKCIVRGVGLVPTVPGCVPWVQAQACPPVGGPVLFGSATCMALDPLTGYIWCGWSSGGEAHPVGGSVALSGSYVLVYDPLAMTLLDAIRIGDVSSGGAVDGIEYRAGSIYVSSPGSAARAAGAALLITQINAASHAIVAATNSTYGGAISVLGMVGQDQNGLYISTVNGIGSGTGHIASTAPFGLTSAYGMSNWALNYVDNPFAGVLAYTGYGSFIDLRSPTVSMSLDTFAYFGAPQTQHTRLAYQVCTDNIFVINVGSPGVLSVNVVTGVISVISATFWPAVIYYSPESDTLYIEGSPTNISARTVRAYQGTSFALLGELPTYTTGALYGGNAIYLGCESFVMSSTYSTVHQMWRVSFPH